MYWLGDLTMQLGNAKLAKADETHLLATPPYDFQFQPGDLLPDEASICDQRLPWQYR